MFSVEQCQTYLKNESYSDAEVEEIRDSLYQLADVLVRQYVLENKKMMRLTLEYRKK